MKFYSILVSFRIAVTEREAKWNRAGITCQRERKRIFYLMLPQEARVKSNFFLFFLWSNGFFNHAGGDSLNTRIHFSNVFSPLPIICVHFKPLKFSIDFFSNFFRLQTLRSCQISSDYPIFKLFTPIDSKFYSLSINIFIFKK